MVRRIEPRCGRRAFLEAAIAAVTIVGPLANAACADADTSLAHDDGVAGGFFAEDGLEDARAIGRRWLAIAAPSATDAEIRRIVAPTAEVVDASARDDDALAALAARIRRDFASGAAWNVDGWTFATTELHLCVLAVLAAK